MIVGINEHEVKDYDDLYNALDLFNEGDEVRVRVLREGTIVEVKLALTDLG